MKGMKWLDALYTQQMYNFISFALGGNLLFGCSIKQRGSKSNNCKCNCDVLNSVGKPWIVKHPAK